MEPINQNAQHNILQRTCVKNSGVGYDQIPSLAPNIFRCVDEQGNIRGMMFWRGSNETVDFHVSE
jgi:hypothetical protein